MVLRRLTGALTALFMLHLSFVASDSACATHMSPGHAAMSEHAGASETARAGLDMSAQMANHASGHAEREQPCETPVQSNCCQALASCSSMFVASSGAPGALVVGRVRIPQNVLDVPASELVAPDTPPPKA